MPIVLLVGTFVADIHHAIQLREIPDSSVGSGYAGLPLDTSGDASAGLFSKVDK